MIRERDELRFWSKVNTGGECWLWEGATSRNGYGAFKVAQRMIGAHQYAYLIVKGEVPQGLEIDHLCRVHNCVRPSHLEAVTCKENLLRGNTNSSKTHCIHGHQFDQRNTRYRKEGYKVKRVCRACNNIRQRQFEKRRRQGVKLCP